ncbi:hypothetical protein JXO52_10145 [bacterium]|nr:hypothetical protein [bacterium]
MSSTSSKWLIGCGIGCGVLVIIGLVLLVGGYFLVKDTVQGIQDAEITLQKLEDRFGRVEDYVPPLDGTLSAGRLETFFTVRDSLSVYAADLENSIEELTVKADEMDDNDEESFRDVMKIVGKGFDLIPRIARYFIMRNRILLTQEMGLGEYSYIYITAYYSWLGKPLDDGPDFPLTGDAENGGRFEWRSDRDESDGSGDARDDRIRNMRRQIRRFMIRAFENSLDESVAGGLPAAGWKASLNRELSNLENDRLRLPWQDGLPSPLERSLRPYRDRFERVYYPTIQSIELQGADF